MTLSIEELKELRGLCNDSTVWASILDELIAIRGQQGKAVAWEVGGYLTFDKKFAESRSNEDNLLLEPLYKHPIITGIDENHYDPELEPGLYVAEIMTKGGAACINGRITDPQKPIVLPKSHYVCGCADRFMSEKQVKAAIEAAGCIVKDGV